MAKPSDIRGVVASAPCRGVGGLSRASVTRCSCSSLGVPWDSQAAQGTYYLPKNCTYPPYIILVIYVELC